MIFHRLELDPRVFAFDKAVDDELHADQVVACGSKVTTLEEVFVCRFEAGHGGPCDWARAP
jgi:hypothetical protein